MASRIVSDIVYFLRIDLLSTLAHGNAFGSNLCSMHSRAANEMSGTVMSSLLRWDPRMHHNDEGALKSTLIYSLFNIFKYKYVFKLELFIEYFA